MKRFLFLIVLLQAATCFSQSLTNRQVYDFEPGDIIEGVHKRFHVDKVTYEIRTILSKTYSKNNDTISYQVGIEYYTPQWCESCVREVSFDTIAQVITNLDGPVTYGDSNYIDTFYKGYCGRMVVEQNAKLDTMPGEYRHEKYQWVEGVGGPFSNIFEDSGPDGFDFDLVYYQKESSTCGQLISGIAEIKGQKVSCEIFPNPSSSVLTVKSSEIKFHYTIVDMTGKIWGAGELENNTVNVTALPAGLYVIRLVSEGHFIYTQTFIKK